MKKIATLAAAALLASAGTYALAQAPAPQAPAPEAPAAGQEQDRPERRRGMSQDDFNRLVDARIAAIKAGLKLTPEQEQLWGPVESAIRTAASERFSRMEQRQENRAERREERRSMDLMQRREERRSMDLMQRLEQRSTRVTERAQSLTALTTALRPLWDTLTEDQKRVAPRLIRPAIGGGMGWRKRDGHRGHGRHHARMMEHQRGMGMGPRGMGGPGGMRGPGGERHSTPAPQQQPQQ